MSLPPQVPFAVSADLDGERAVVTVRGEVDVVTAPALRAAVDSAIDGGHSAVVLDLSAVNFMDASGLRVIAGAAARLGRSDGELSLGAPSAAIRRILDITGLTGVVRIEDAPRSSQATEPATGHLGPEQTAAAPGTPVTSETSDLAQQLRRVTAVPADDDVVDGALQLVVALARATVGGADGVSVSLRRRGHLGTVAASDQTISDMDADQYATGEGPCVDASVHGRWFHVESLHTEKRWPDFTPKARALGINAILSSPLLTDDRPIGSLNIYSRRPRVFTPKDQELASVFATEASRILNDAGVDVSDEELAARLDEALWTRQRIAQAQGAVMARDGVDEDTAYATLRRASVESGTPLQDQAEAVLAAIRGHRSERRPAPMVEADG